MRQKDRAALLGRQGKTKAPPGYGRRSFAASSLPHLPAAAGLRPTLTAVAEIKIQPYRNLFYNRPRNRGSGGSLSSVT